MGPFFTNFEKMRKKRKHLLVYFQTFSLLTLFLINSPLSGMVLYHCPMENQTFTQCCCSGQGGTPYDVQFTGTSCCERTVLEEVKVDVIGTPAFHLASQVFPNAEAAFSSEIIAINSASLILPNCNSPPGRAFSKVPLFLQNLSILV